MTKLHKPFSVPHGRVFASVRHPPRTPPAMQAGREQLENFREMVVRVASDMNRQASPRPQANANGAPRGANAAIADIQATVEEQGNRFDQIEASIGAFQQALDDVSSRTGALATQRSSASDEAPPEPEYTRLFASYFRGGRGEHELQDANNQGERGAIRAAMTTGSPGDGGYLAPVEWDRTINKKLLPISPMRQVCDVRQTGVRGFSTLWNGGAWGSGWVGETASRPATSTPTLAPITFTAGELYAMPVASQGLLDDAAIDMAGWIADELADTFAAQENIAFVSGDGVNKPNGFLTYVTGAANAAAHPGGAIALVASGQASSIGTGATAADMLLDFVYGLKAPYRGPNAKWMMNSVTASIIAKLKDGQQRYLWNEALVSGQPSTLLGYEVVINEDMPDIAAGNTPIAFGDFQRGYLINDRMGIRILRDPFTSKPFVNFYTTKRVGGGLKDPNALRVLKIAAS